MNLPKINVIGDSHVSVFSGFNKVVNGWPGTADRIDHFSTYHIGPVLAYNINTQDHIGNKNLKRVLKKIPEKSYIMLSFGEIDCRAHLIRVAIDSGRKQTDVVDECVNRYFEIFKYLIDKKYNVIGLAVPPPHGEDKSLEIKESDNNKYPVIGTLEQRSKITKYFNLVLSRKCEGKKIPFINISSYITDSNGYLIDKKYRMDLIHLSTETLPFFEKELSNKLVI